MKVLKKFAPSRFGTLALVVFMAGTILGLGAVLAFSSNNQKTINVAETPCQDICVDLREYKADPETLTVTVGSFVQFNSADGKSHDLSLGKGGEEHSHQGKFRSGEFQANEGWRVQFNEEGSFFFHDHLNPKINVLIVVYTPGKEYIIE